MAILNVNDSDFDDATLLLNEAREDEDLFNALEKRKQLAELTFNLDNSTKEITEEYILYNSVFI